MSTKKGSAAVERIREFRASLGLSQEQFAKKLQVTRVAVVHWETGRSEPGSAAYLNLAQLAKNTDRSTALWFFEQAGIDTDTLRALVPEFDKSFRLHEKRLKESFEQGVLSIPVVGDAKLLREPHLKPEDSDKTIAVDAVYVPVSARAFIVPQQQGYPSRFPSEGDIIVIDPQNVIDADNSRDIEQLADRLVIALTEDERAPNQSLLLPPGIWIGELHFTQFSTGYGGSDREAVVMTGQWQARIARKTIDRREGFGGIVSGETNFSFYPSVKFVAPVFQWVRGTKKGTNQ